MKSRAKTTLRHLILCALFRSSRERRVHRRRRDCSDDAATRGGGRRRGPAPAARRVRVRGDRAPWVMTRTTRPPSPCHAPGPDAASPRRPLRCRPTRARGGGGRRAAERGDGRERSLGAFARWTRRRAARARLPAKRWRLTAEEQAEDASSHIGAARARPAASTPPARAHPRDAAACARVRHLRLASHRTRAGAAKRRRRARRRGALPRRRAPCRATSARRRPRAIADAFRHAGVWDVASDARRCAHARDAEDAGDASHGRAPGTPGTRVGPGARWRLAGTAAAPRTRVRARRSSG